MKWGIIVLLILGIVAAACAAMLVGTLRTDSSTSASKSSSSNVEVAMTKISMPAMTVITLDHVIKEEVAKEKLPEGRLSSPSKVIGKVLAVPVVKGQILTDSCFVAEGTGAHLAAALPYGMRAVSINLSNKAIPDELLLYPGCVVDVLVSFKLSSADRSRGQAISTTMLRRVQVLAVAGDSVVSKQDQDKEGESTARARRTGGVVTVTLMIDPRQAEALQLAADNGSISLSIRNPLDKKLVDMEATVLSQGRLASLGSVLTPAVFSSTQNIQKEHVSLTEQPLINGDTQVQTQVDSDTDMDIMGQEFISDEKHKIRQYPRWGVIVIRGREATVEELDIHQGEPAAAATAIK
jgi:pilus assembly protein CpaB